MIVDEIHFLYIYIYYIFYYLYIYFKNILLINFKRLFNDMI